MSRKRCRLASPYKWLLMIPFLLGAAALAVPVGVLSDIIYMTFVQLIVFDRRGVFIDVIFFNPGSYYLWPLVWGVFAEIGITAAVFLTIESVDRREQRQKSPFRWLWLIPIQLLCTVFMLFFGLFLDSRIYNADAWIHSLRNSIVRETGRGVPLYMPRGMDYCDICLPLAGVVFTVIVTVVAIILAVVERKKGYGKKDGQKDWRKASEPAKEG